MLAQKLYEGVELGDEGSVGLITYMRTDSTRVSDTALGEVRDYINSQYGGNYLPEKPSLSLEERRAGRARSDPSDRNCAHARLAGEVSQARRAETLSFDLAALCRVADDARSLRSDDDRHQAGRFIFRATGSVQKFDGFLKIYQEGRDEKTEDDDEAERSLPLVEKGETLKLFDHARTALHRAAAALHGSDAGESARRKRHRRPSTYAAIMSTIQEREYVEKIQSRFHPTALGKTVNDLLIDGGFDDLFNETYTARMEEESSTRSRKEDPLDQSAARVLRQV